MKNKFFLDYTERQKKKYKDWNQYIQLLMAELNELININHSELESLSI